MQSLLKIVILVLICFLSFTTSYSQQQPIFTQYMFNGLVINPAYTGSQGSLTATASVRRQWAGLKGAPQTEVFSAHSPIKFSRSSAGVVAIHDKVGVTNQSTIYGAFAYRIPVSATANIAVGVQAGAMFYRANYSQLDIVGQTADQKDNSFTKDQSRVMPNLGMGVYFYSKRTYIGLSLPTIVDNQWKSNDPANQAKQERHYFLSAGHVFDLRPNLKFKPNFLIKWVEDATYQYDFNANFLIHDVLWLGASYRMNDSVDAIIEWNVNKQFSFGYSYGYPINSLSAVQSGTHEIVLNFRIKQKKNVVLSPRFF